MVKKKQVFGADSISDTKKTWTCPLKAGESSFRRFQRKFSRKTAGTRDRTSDRKLGFASF